MSDEQKKKVFISTCLSSLCAAIGGTVGMLGRLALEGRPATSLADSLPVGIFTLFIAGPGALFVSIIASEKFSSSLGQKDNLFLMGSFFLLGAIFGPGFFLAVFSGG